MAMSSGVSAMEWLGGLGLVRVSALGMVELSDGELMVGLGEVRRLRGELARLQAELVARVVATSGRDSVALVSRELGLTTGEAREAVNAAVVLASHPELADAVGAGELQPGHLAAVRRVAEESDRAALLAGASTQSVEGFRDAVRQFRIDQAGPAWRERQRAARSVTFFNGGNDCLGMRAILPSVDGARLRERLREIMNAAYRAEHPERAKVAGGHRPDDVEQRMADALIALLDGTGESTGGGKAAVVVVVDPQQVTAEIIGQGPIAFDDAVDLAADRARAEVYGIMQDTNGAVLKFGRNRRFASALQRLAIAVRDRRCVVDGCGRPATECEAHHEPPFEDGGRTDVDVMEARCSAHHQHRHETGVTGPLRTARRGPPDVRTPTARSPDDLPAAA